MRSPLVTRKKRSADAEREELVVVSSPFFPHKLSQGYSNPPAESSMQLTAPRVRSLSHLVSLLRDLKGEFVTMNLTTMAARRWLFPNKEMVAATEEILTDNGVRAQGSADTLAVWRAKSAK